MAEEKSGCGGYSKRAYKQLDATRRTKAGWGQNHHKHLLTAFGFVFRDGGKHRTYYVPDHKDIRVMIPRHGELKAYVAEQVVEAIDKLLERKGIKP